MNRTLDTVPTSSHMLAEVASQPDMWRRATAMRDEMLLLPQPGQSVAIIGCGTSWFMAQSYAALREDAGHGVTDAFAASESRVSDRDYDCVIALTRSGTTTEVLEEVTNTRHATRTLCLVGDETSPLVDLVDSVIALPFADEKSVVQTRFATTALMFLRASLGETLDTVCDEAEAALKSDLPDALTAAEQITFLGRGWSVGIAHEAALKLREAAQSWTESYPAMEYRHGPISIAAPGRATWMFGAAPHNLEKEFGATGAHFESLAIDPVADLVRVHRLALARAELKGLNVDQPRNLSRSVVLADQ